MSGISRECHGKVATSQDELEQVVPTVDGTSEDVVLSELHYMHMRNCVGEVTRAEI